MATAPSRAAAPSARDEQWARGERHPGRKGYDCVAGYWNWRRGWSDGKKQWCCFHKSIACSGAPPPKGGAPRKEDPARASAASKPATAATKPFDCEAGYSGWKS